MMINSTIKQACLILTVYFSIVIFLFSSCNGTPKNYQKGQSLFLQKKYDSAFIHFSSLLGENSAWADSALIMQKKCFIQMTHELMWKAMGKTLSQLKSRKPIYDTANKIIINTIAELLKSGREKDVFEATDNPNSGTPQELFFMAINKYLDDFLMSSDWEAGGDLQGHVIYFSREEFTSKYVQSKGKLLQGKSRNTVKSWHTGRVIYRNLRYEKGGKFRLEPLLLNDENYEYGENGMLQIINKDSIKINYGLKLSTSSSKKVFRRYIPEALRKH